MIRLLTGDARELLKTLPDESVHCCVTSPPYWGLRDYGVEGQLGLEKTPELYVAEMVGIFREVRRVLRGDGTLWLNLGDSYSGSWARSDNPGGKGGLSQMQASNLVSYTVGEAVGRAVPRVVPDGLKPKDLCGIPWMVAKALRDPYYTGKIARELDRVWLAAMIDAEGCLFIHKRKAGQSNGQGYFRQNDNYGPGLEVANTSESIVKRCVEITGLGSICSQSPDQNKRRKQKIYRWNLRTTECRDVIREIYPYLVAKKHQARLLCGCPPSGSDAERAHAGLMALHNGCDSDIDFGAPASMYEQGWWLRQDIVWAKSNPMPESVRDRCTKAHEYIFLLSKSSRYYYDQDAIREPLRDASVARLIQDIENQEGSDRVPGKTNGNMKAVRFGGTKYGDDESKYHNTKSGKEWTPKQAGSGGINDNRSGYFDKDTGEPLCGSTANKKSVWTVTTQGYSEAHFATFPPDLIEPCIKAGCPVGGTVLDPFSGAGTTGLVSARFQRNYIGIELNKTYVEMSKNRIEQDAPMFNEVQV